MKVCVALVFVFNSNPIFPANSRVCSPRPSHRAEPQRYLGIILVGLADKRLRLWYITRKKDYTQQVTMFTCIHIILHIKSTTSLNVRLFLLKFCFPQVGLLVLWSARGCIDIQLSICVPHSSFFVGVSRPQASSMQRARTERNMETTAHNMLLQTHLSTI